jgi:ParB-like nuclease family protein
MTASPGELAGCATFFVAYLQDNWARRISGAVGFAFLQGLEMAVIDRTNSISSYGPFTEPLRQKSRRRRDQQERLATASAPRPRRNDILPRLELSYIPIDALRPSPRKLRKVDPAHVREVAASIGALGFCVPILVGRDNEIIHGEVSYEASKQLGLDRLPCIRIGHLTPEEQRVLRLAINRLAEKGEWNLDALKIEFDELILLDAPIEITGFSPAEIDQVILGDAGEGLEQGRLSLNPAQPRSPGLAIRSNSVPIVSYAATQRIPQFLLDCSKATTSSVSS